MIDCGNCTKARRGDCGRPPTPRYGASAKAAFTDAAYWPVVAWLAFRIWPRRCTATLHRRLHRNLHRKLHRALQKIRHWRVSVRVVQDEVRQERKRPRVQAGTKREETL